MKETSLPHCFKPGDSPWNKVGETAIDESSTTKEADQRVQAPSEDWPGIQYCLHFKT
jgi:hypothetical protein